MEVAPSGPFSSTAPTLRTTPLQRARTEPAWDGPSQKSGKVLAAMAKESQGTGADAQNCSVPSIARRGPTLADAAPAPAGPDIGFSSGPAPVWAPAGAGPSWQRS